MQGKAGLYRHRGYWYVRWYKDGKRIRETTGTKNKKLAKEVLEQRERDMVLGTLSVSRKVETALHDPHRREAVLEADLSPLI